MSSAAVKSDPHVVSPTGARDALASKAYLESFPAQEGQVPSLDGLRAVSILLVLLGHFVLPRAISGIGALGVTTFFFVSGFLITRLSLLEQKRNHRLDIPRFFARRLIRLYPVILISMIPCVGLALFRGQTIDGLELASVLFYFSNYLIAYRELIGVGFTFPIGPFWSLSVEEHFYFLFPIVFVFFVRGDARRLAAVAVAVCVLCLATRLLYYLIWPDLIGTLATYWRSETRFDAIAFGVLLAALCETKQGRQVVERIISRDVLVASAVLLAVSYVYRDPFYQGTVRLTLQSLALLPLVAGVVFSANIPLANNFLNLRPAVWIGKISYSLYVWHGAVIFLFAGLVRNYLPAALGSWSLLVISFGVAALSYYLVEIPFSGLRRHFHPKRTLNNRDRY